MSTKRKRTRRRKKRYHTGVYVSKKTGQACKYRSGWELKYLEHLDANPDVVTFGYETVKIPYVSNVRTGKVRHYYPDFIVTLATTPVQLLVEIKPKKRLDQAKVKKKLDAARHWCSEHACLFLVITEHELKGMGLL